MRLHQIENHPAWWSHFVLFQSLLLGDLFWLSRECKGLRSWICHLFTSSLIRKSQNSPYLSWDAFQEHWSLYINRDGHWQCLVATRLLGLLFLDLLSSRVFVHPARWVRKKNFQLSPLSNLILVLQPIFMISNLQACASDLADGFRCYLLDKVTLSQIKTYTEMDSHEERLPGTQFWGWWVPSKTWRPSLPKLMHQGTWWWNKAKSMRSGTLSETGWKSISNYRYHSSLLGFRPLRWT